MSTFIDPSYIYAVVGDKFDGGSSEDLLVQAMSEKGYEVFPVSPYCEEVQGIACAPTLLEVDERPDVIVIDLPEELAKSAVQQCIDLDLNRIWFQPESESEDAVNLAEEHSLYITTASSILDDLPDAR